MWGEVEGRSERGSDLEINRAADGVDFTKFSPGLKISRALFFLKKKKNPAEGTSHLHSQGFSRRSYQPPVNERCVRISVN